MPIAAFGVLFASIGFGLTPYFSRGLTDQGLASHAVAFYRYTLAAVFLIPILLRSSKQWKELCWGLASGITMGLGWIGYVSALKTAPASTVGVIYMTYPVFTVLLAWALFAEPPTRRALLATGIIVLAAVIAGSPGAVSPDQIPALIFALAAPFGFGLSIVVLVHRLSRLVPLARIGSVSLGAVLGLMPLMLASDPQTVIPQDQETWILIVGIATVSALIPQLIYMVCSPIIGASKSAVFGSVELPTMFAVAVFALGEALTWPQAIACVLILSANPLGAKQGDAKRDDQFRKAVSSMPAAFCGGPGSGTLRADQALPTFSSNDFLNAAC
jgi:drug/metabolite transporter (DMT)-like permease